MNIKSIAPKVLSFGAEEAKDDQGNVIKGLYQPCVYERCAETGKQSIKRLSNKRLKYNLAMKEAYILHQKEMGANDARVGVLEALFG